MMAYNYVPETTHLSHLRETLAANTPFCSGTLDLEPDQLEMYYGRENAQ